MNELHLTIETTRRGAFRATYTIGRFLQRSTGRNVVDRAVRRLLEWWRASADPRRSLLRCGACDGRTVMWSKEHGSWFSCPRCAGTGKAVKL